MPITGWNNPTQKIITEQEYLMLPKLGIIAGNGLLPSELANIYTKQGGSCHLIALSGQCDIELIKNFQYEVFYIGNAGAIIDYCYEH